eukprot:TRINITY_DN9444_c0_g1_i1.p1 TRINITY_DN9444_c0_g1~~TRINITY_DN9444_c0_g1_i1.p1  ORF type:complete len:118 (-),score=24.25 TRINITY_DN9444_c0_g1_i1:191-544(-)
MKDILSSFPRNFKNFQLTVHAGAFIASSTAVGLPWKVADLSIPPNVKHLTLVSPAKPLMKWFRAACIPAPLQSFTISAHKRNMFKLSKKILKVPSFSKNILEISPSLRLTINERRIN